MGPDAVSDDLWPAITGCDAWLDLMRQDGGYGGPVVHWWRDCTEYTGPGLDWRYEGIVLGYLNLWRATAERKWLDKARRAGDDLLAGQLPSGNYHNSCFEQNPNTGGTPHEAACDLALLRLAVVLKDEGLPGWRPYAEAAERNIRLFLIGRLWDPESRRLWDAPGVPSFVPNKAATAAEAFFALSDLTGDDQWEKAYGIPLASAVVEYQIETGRLGGGIWQNELRGDVVRKVFPFYVARCIPALVQAHRRTGVERFADAALAAGGFLLRVRDAEGAFPQVLYGGGRIQPYPRWVAAVADILRALDPLRELGFEYDPDPSLSWMLAGQEEDGGIRSADGFGRIGLLHWEDDPRDGIKVCGWVDKVFRYLSGRLIQDSADELAPAAPESGARPNSI